MKAAGEGQEAGGSAFAGEDSVEVGVVDTEFGGGTAEGVPFLLEFSERC